MCLDHHLLAIQDLPAQANLFEFPIQHEVHLIMIYYNKCSFPVYLSYDRVTANNVEIIKDNLYSYQLCASPHCSSITSSVFTLYFT